MTTEWTGNDGATWVALQDTTFDAVISPVATLDDIGDSGLGVYLKLDGTSVMGGDLDMGGFDVDGAREVSSVGATYLALKDFNGVTRLYTEGGGFLFLYGPAGSIVVTVKDDEVLLGQDLDMGNQPIINADSIQIVKAGGAVLTLADSLNSASVESAERDFGSDIAFKNHGALGMTLQHGGGGLHVEDNVVMKGGGYVETYDPTPPLYGGGDTFWYQGRNIRFKDTVGPPSDSEGQDGDVCLMYTF